MDKVIISIFTDPMMGLSYECEPIFRKLETHFPKNIEYRHIMCGLVKNVYDFTNPADLPKGKDIAIKNYNARLAKIYESEESISGMPINMTNFRLFDTEHTSSIPLNLAYKAAQIADKTKADLFLYNLRYATIVECRPTTHREEIMKVARATNLDMKKFEEIYDTKAKAAFEEDLTLAYNIGIRSLPAYLFEYREEKFFAPYMMDYDAFVSVIDKITIGRLQPQKVAQTTDNLRIFLQKHPLISPIEIREAFDLIDIDAVKRFIAPLIDE
ncbi:MAG: DsbA family protein [Selenomonadaceae bacterium]|nr:DsbA family protein [Selenomonadaceae bacterium]